VDIGVRIDQRIVGGSDLYIPGQGIQSAPGFYNNRVMAAAFSGGFVFNKTGQQHPSKTGTAFLRSVLSGGAIASNPDDMLFFQF